MKRGLSAVSPSASRRFVSALFRLWSTVHGDAVGPEPVAQRLARDELFETLEQRAQHVERLLLHAHQTALLPQFASAQIHFEDSEPTMRRPGGVTSKV
jgi:hypothetical protein